MFHRFACIAAVSLAIFAGDTVTLVVTKDRSSVDGKWDPVSGKDPNKRYIKVSAGPDVELKGDGAVKTNINCSNIYINPNNKSECNTSCVLGSSSSYHKLHTSGHYIIKGSGGSGGSGGKERVYVWNAVARTEGKFEIKPFNSVRRRYGDKDPGEVTKVSIKGEKGVVYKLKIENISGEGDAAFDEAGTQKEMDYTGTGSETQIPLYGLKESTEEHNIKITGSKDGELLDEQKFIVFSEIKIDWSSDETQHKDTAASCKLCANQPERGHVEFGPEHRHYSEGPEWKEVKPCDHKEYASDCEHCASMCARCCMKQITGGHQDDYRNFNNSVKTTVEENHGEMLDSLSARKKAEEKGHPITRFVRPKYDIVYRNLLKLKKIIGGKGLHAEIIYSICWNESNGTVFDPKVFYWDPKDAQNSKECFYSEYTDIYPEKL